VRDLHYDSLHLTTIEEIKQQIEYSLSQNALVILGLNNPDHYVIITAVDDAPHGALTVNIFDPYNCQSSPKTLKVGTLSSNSGSLSLHYMRYNVNGDEYIIDATIGDLIGHPDPNKK